MKNHYIKIKRLTKLGNKEGKICPSFFLFISPSNILRHRLERERERRMLVESEIIGLSRFRVSRIFAEKRDGNKISITVARVVPPFYEIFTRPRNCACITCAGDQLRLLLFAFTECKFRNGNERVPNVTDDSVNPIVVSIFKGELFWFILTVPSFLDRSFLFLES